MKTKQLLYILPCILLLSAGCKKFDNYDAPDSGVFGRVIDAGTGQPLETRQPGGGQIRFLQVDPRYPSPGPIDIELKSDGQFNATQFFASPYLAFPRDGAFQYFGDSTQIELRNGQKTEINFEVEPFYRIEAAVTDSTFTYTISKPASNTFKLTEIIFMVNNYNIVNEAVSSNTSGYYINLWKQTISSGTPDNTILDQQRTFTFKWADTHLPKGEYFFRVGARTGSVARYNYSPVVKATVH